MSDPVVAVVMLGIFVLTILLGFPICFTLMAMGVAFGFYAYYDAERMRSIFDNQIFDLLVNQTYSVMANDVLTAVPLFLFMGYIVERANIVNRLFSSLQIAARRMPGSMAIAALATCALFATATGIIGAVVTLMGPARVSRDAQGPLRHQLLRRGDLRGRMPRHPDPPEHHAHRLRRDLERLGGAALRGRDLPRLHAGGALHRLRHRARDAQPEARAQTEGGGDRGSVVRPGHRDDADLVLSPGVPDLLGARRDPVRSRDALRGRLDGCARRAGPGRVLPAGGESSGARPSRRPGRPGGSSRTAAPSYCCRRSPSAASWLWPPWR